MRFFIYFILASWFSLCVFIDIIAVPTIFRSLTSLEEAGRLGMKFFSFINSVEIIFALIFLAFILYSCQKKSLKKILIIPSIILLILSATYKFHITPTISALNTKKYESSLTQKEMETLKQTHNKYHELYKKLDTFKLLLLLCLLIHLGVKWNRQNKFKDDEKGKIQG